MRSPRNREANIEKRGESRRGRMPACVGFPAMSGVLGRSHSPPARAHVCVCARGTGTIDGSREIGAGSRQTPSLLHAVDTSQIIIRFDPPGQASVIPDWAEASVRQGVRRSLELLRASAMPERVVITLRDSASEALGTKLGRQVGDHTGTDVAVSIASALRRRYGSADAFDAEEAPAVLAYCAAHEAALFALDVGAETPGWRPGYVAEAMAIAASGFTLLQRESEHELQVLLHLVMGRLAHIRRTEGPAALWRGEVRRTIDDLSKRVRIAQTPGIFDLENGDEITPERLHALLDHLDGRAPWPA